MLIFGAWPLEIPCVPQSGTGSNPHIHCCPSGLCQSTLAGTEETDCKRLVEVGFSIFPTVRKQKSRVSGFSVTFFEKGS